MELEIIDFHTHPFTNNRNNICSHTNYCDMSIENTLTDMKKLGISKIRGSVIGFSSEEDKCFNIWEKLHANNIVALELSDIYGDFYIPGFHVHPGFVRESCEEIEHMDRKGIHLIGELVPYIDGWNDYSCKEFSEILDVAQQHNMVVSFHSMGEDEIDKMVMKHPNVTFVAAHPGEYNEFVRHMERMKKIRTIIWIYPVMAFSDMVCCVMQLICLVLSVFYLAPIFQPVILQCILVVCCLIILLQIKKRN